MEGNLDKNSKKAGAPGTPASNIKKSKKLLTLGAGILAAASTSAQALKKPFEHKWVPQKEMQYYKDATENGVKLEDGIRFSDIKDGDTTVRNVFPLPGKAKDLTVEFKEQYWKDPKKPQEPALNKAPIEVRVNEKGDTEKVYQLVNKKINDTIQFTHVVPGPKTPRKNAPGYLGEINSDIFAAKESDAIAGKNHPASPISPVSPTRPPQKLENVQYKAFNPGDISYPNIANGEDPTPEKQPEAFSNNVGPNIFENSGDIPGFIKNNTMHFYRWLKEKNNWRNMSIGDWHKLQEKFKFLDNKMNEALAYYRGGNPHDDIEHESDLNYLFVKKMILGNDPTTLDQAMSEWKEAREKERGAY